MRKKPKLITFDRPFTRAEYLAAGGGRSALRGARYREIAKAIYVDVDQEDSDARVRAALMVHPENAFASHWSAGRVLKLPVPDNPFEHVTVRDRKERRYRPWLKPHVTIRKRGVIVVRGIPVTDPITTFLQTGRSSVAGGPSGSRGRDRSDLSDLARPVAQGSTGQQ